MSVFLQTHSLENHQHKPESRLDLGLNPTGVFLPVICKSFVSLFLVLMLGFITAFVAEEIMIFSWELGSNPQLTLTISL